MRIDPFYSRQPSPHFVAELSRPVHEKAPIGFRIEKAPGEGEVSARGMHISVRFPESEGLLCAAYEDFAAFLAVTGAAGSRYPLSLVKGEVAGKESFRLSVTREGATVVAEESEGVRRALVYIEEEMTKREGALLPLGEVQRKPYIRTRMTRGFFSPTNRAPKFGDELLDAVDYYPDEYLNRLAHNGTNAIWIYTSFRALIDTPVFKQNKAEVAARVAKLSRVVNRCARYGVKVYIFAIEPHGLAQEDAALHPELLGGRSVNGIHTPVCLRAPEAQEYTIGAVERLFRAVPMLGGYISITAGERTTTCPSVLSYTTCPRCSKYSRGENLAFGVDIIKEGIRRAGTDAEFVSWTYGHRYWSKEDICDYVRNAPTDVRLMQNFEDGGVNMQLGKPRIAWDYWLSYVGPCEKYILTAEEAKKRGCEMWAKMQVCNSHELATVPYIPAPGILYDKYKKARELGTTGIMECWYFGNYPSLMSRASGALSFLDRFESKAEFLLEFAARLYGESRAKAVAAALRAFEAGYKNYPTNVMFNYYGPMHDGVVWRLQLHPKNNPLSRTWLLPDIPDGDRIGECLFNGHTVDEAITLAEQISTHWAEGLSLLPLPADDELSTLAGALGVLFSSGTNILRFYRLRAALGKGEGDAKAILEKMRALVEAEIDNSEKMVDLCQRDSCLGYHSEAEGFKFFPEKLLDRIAWLKTLLSEEFSAVEQRIAEGKVPLGYYYAEGEQAYRIGSGEVRIDEERAFSVEMEEGGVCTAVSCPLGDDVTIDYEFDLFMPESGIVISESPMETHPESVEAYPPGLGLTSSATSHQSLFGESIKSELARHRLTREERENGRVLYRVHTAVPMEKWNRKTAIKLRITVGGKGWITSPDPVSTLGKTSVIPDEYGFLLPSKEN